MKRSIGRLVAESSALGAKGSKSQSTLGLLLHAQVSIYFAKQKTLPKMLDAIIENPIINSPYEEPRHHFKFEREGITNALVEGKRKSLSLFRLRAPKHAV